MVKPISISEYYSKFIDIPIIDVRSPGEFKRGHIPHAINIPLFSDEERAQVGIVYKQKSKQKAIDLGYTYVNPKLEYFIEASQKASKNGAVAVHCWRGGMRSQSFANHLVENGFNKVYLIENGYKAFRNYVLDFFKQNFILKVVGGYTGSGKTEILYEIAKAKNQVVDLEKLANHKGSAFGGIGQKEQPTSEYFANIIFDQMREMNLNLPIWIEDESKNLGQAFLPDDLFSQMREQGVLFIDIPRIERAAFLVKYYGNQSKEKLIDAILRISKRLGPINTKEALAAIEKGDFLKVAELSLIYYDKSYLRGLATRNKNTVTSIKFNRVDAKENAKELLSVTK